MKYIQKEAPYAIIECEQYDGTEKSVKEIVDLLTKAGYIGHATQPTCDSIQIVLLDNKPVVQPLWTYVSIEGKYVHYLDPDYLKEHYVAYSTEEQFMAAPAKAVEDKPAVSDFVKKLELPEGINVLGTEYKLLFDKYDAPIIKDCFGVCCYPAREIHMLDFSTDPEWSKETESVIYCQFAEALRHEIIHAFLIESGLKQNSSATEHWATNEEMIDWLAKQWPKVQAVFDQLHI